jgi:hypothetical protein
LRATLAQGLGNKPRLYAGRQSTREVAGAGPSVRPVPVEVDGQAKI